MSKPVYVGNTNRAILDGELDLSVWSEEELIRGQRRGRNGKWQGRKPKVVPMAVHDELVRRKMSRAYELLQDNVVAATEVLVSLATDEAVEDATRLKAATLILDRVLGKEPMHITVDVEPAWAVALRNATVPLGIVGGVIDVTEDDG